MKKLIISFALIFALLVTLFAGIPISAKAADSVVSPSTNRRALVNMSQSSTYVSGSVQSTKFIKSGDYTAKWSNHSANQWATFKPMLNNFDAFQAFEFWVYSEKATNLDRRLNITNPNNSSGEIVYFSYIFNVNWTGWRHFYIHPSDFANNRSAKWNNIVEINFVSSGWDLVPDTGTVLYFDTIYGILSENSDNYQYLDKCIADFSFKSTFDKIGGYFKNKQEYTGYASGNLLWDDTVNNTILNIPDCPKDCTEYEYLQFRMYSVKATGQQIRMHFLSPETSQGMNYYDYPIDINWSGWKLFTVKLSDIPQTRSPSWKNIEKVRIDTAGWEMTPKADTKIYFDNIYLLKKASTTSQIKHTGTSIVNSLTVFPVDDDSSYKNPGTNVVKTSDHAGETGFSACLRGDVTGTTMLFKEGRRDLSSYDTMRLKIYCDFAFPDNTINFSAYGLGPNGENYNAYTISYPTTWTGWKTIDIRLNRLYYASGNNTMHYMYLPVINGINITCSNNTNYYFDSIKVIQTKEIYDVDTFFIPPAFTYKINDNLVKYFFGDQTTNNTSNSIIKSKIDSINNSAKSLADSMNKSGTGDLWAGDTNTIDIKTGNFSTNIKTMASAYGTYGGKYYHSDEMYNNVRFALDRFCKDYFGEKQVNERGGDYNWWWWAIHIPSEISVALSCIRDRLSYDDLYRYVYAMSFFVVPEWQDGSNLANESAEAMAVYALRGDAERVLYFRDMTNELFLYTDDGSFENTSQTGRNGFYHDGAYLFHDYYLITGSYGVEHLGNCTKIMFMLNKTIFCIDSSKLDNVYTWVFETFDPVTYRNYMMSAAGGRAAGREPFEKSQWNGYVSTIVDLSQLYTGEKQTKLYSLIKKYFSYNDRSAAVRLPCVQIAQSIMYGSISVPIYQRTGYTKIMGSVDKIFNHNSNGYSVALSMSSTRTGKYENINGENTTGWYQGDGMLYVYTNNNKDYEFDDYLRRVNPYKLPGTTATTAKRNELYAQVTFNSYNFAGGVSQGQNVAAAIRVGAFNCDTFKSTLDSQQSYFMFDNEIVCLGTNITCSDGYETLSTIENRRSSSSTTLQINGQNTTLSNNTETSKAGVKSAYLSSMGGYYFPDSSKTLKLNKNVNNGNTFYEMWYSHGKDPKGASYSYVQLPDATPEQTTAYASAPDISIIRNDSSVQAVSEKSTGSTGYIFWMPDTCGDVTAERFCSAMVTRKDGKITISVSDPRQLEDKISLTVRNIPTGYKLTSKDAKVTATLNGSTATIVADTKEAMGKTFTAEFQYTGNYTVSFDNQSATSAGTTSVSVANGGTMPNITAPAKTNYVFNGYFTEKNGQGTKYYNADGTPAVAKYPLYTNLTLYAYWTPASYSITYKDKGGNTFTGSTSGLPTKHTYGTATNLVPSSRDEYYFAGWYTSSDCSGSAITSLSATGYTNNITLYACWKRYGDANLDGNINSTDALLALKHSVNILQLTADNFIVSDVDLNKTVNVVDALLILQRSVDIIKTLPVK